MAIQQVKITGADELTQLLKEIAQDYSPAQANKFLVGAVRQAMKPTLATAKRLVPVDTGALRASLQVEARRPTSRDKRSQYIQEGDTVIGLVTTASGKKLANKSFTNVRTGKKQKGIPSDARHIATEFGTRKLPARPYLRPALESNTGNMTGILGVEINKQLVKYERK